MTEKWKQEAEGCGDEGKQVLSPLTTQADVSTEREAAAGQYQTALKALLHSQCDAVHVCLRVRTLIHPKTTVIRQVSVTIKPVCPDDAVFALHLNKI